MAWEWVGPTATALVGIVGIASTFLTGKQQRETQLKAIQSQYRADIALEVRKSKTQLFAKFLGSIDQFLYDHRIRDTLSKELEKRNSEIRELIDNGLYSDPAVLSALEEMHPGITTNTEAMESIKGPLERKLRNPPKTMIKEALREHLRSFGVEEAETIGQTISLRELKVLCSEVQLVASESAGMLAHSTIMKLVSYCRPSPELSDAEINSAVSSLSAALKKELHFES